MSDSKRQRDNIMIGKKKTSVKLLIIAVLALGTIWAGFPVLWMISNSFKANAEIFEWPPRLFTENFSFDAYAKVFQNPEQVRFFVNSYCIAILVVILTLIIGIMASYGFSRFQFRGKELINTVIISVQAVPPHHAADSLSEPDRDIKTLQYVFCIDFNLPCLHFAVLYSDDDRLFQHDTKGIG